MDHLEVHESDLPCGVVVRLRGPMTSGRLGALEQSLQRHAVARRPLVVLEISGVSVMGSESMGVLLGFARSAREWWGIVRLCGPQPSVAESLRRARLDLVLPIVDTLDDALGPAIAARASRPAARES